MMRSGCRLSRRRSLTEVSTQVGKVKRNSSTMLNDIWLPEEVVMLIGGEEGGGRGGRRGVLCPTCSGCCGDMVLCFTDCLFVVKV